MYNGKSRYVYVMHKCFLRLDYSKKRKRKKEKRKEKKRNQNRIKSGLSQFLFPQQKMEYVALMAIFIIFSIV